MADLNLFPYEPRGEQYDLIDFIRTAVIQGKDAVIESGTGTGKTVSSLAGVLEDQPYHKFKVIYLTRTKSQQKQVIHEIREINRKRPVFCVPIQGRSTTTCPMMIDDPELSSGSPDELSKWCSEYKKRKGKEGSCPYFEAMDSVDLGKFIFEMRRSLPEPESFQKRCIDLGICPYEMSKLCLPFADVVCAPYSFMLTPPARHAFLDWMEITMEEAVIIVDEAHNIPDYLREVIAAEYTSRALDLAEKEALEWGDPIVYQDLRVTDIIAAMRVCFDGAVKDYLREEDGLIPPHYVEEELMSRLSLTSMSLMRIFKTIVDLGEIVAEDKKARKTDSCIGCGYCFQVCPTKALEVDAAGILKSAWD